MSSIRDISSSNYMPVDLAKKLGKNGIVEILDVMWKSFDDLKAERIIDVTWKENDITQEWFRCVSHRWYSENRASRISINIYPTVQYEDTTLAKARGQAPAIDFCFRAWEKSDGYFGAECKNLYDHDKRHITRYVKTGVDNYVSGRYGSKSKVSSMVGYVLTGSTAEIVSDLITEIAKEAPHSNINRIIDAHDNQYQSQHRRVLDGELITLYHLFFDFAA